jgi:L-ascorbate metabolism protein UlaG (beta-lactamase superfamily)
MQVGSRQDQAGAGRLRLSPRRGRRAPGDLDRPLHGAPADGRGQSDHRSGVQPARLPGGSPPRLARHFSNRRLGDRNRSLWGGFALAVDGWRAWFAGDTAYHPEFGEVGARAGPLDFVMIPIGAYDPRWFMERVHVDPEEAVRIYQDVSAPHPDAARPLMLGIHWGTFRLTDEPMDEPPRRALARWREMGLDEGRLWIAAFGETRSVG